MDAQQNNGSQPRALTSVPAAVLTNTCSDAVLNVDGYCVKNDPRVRTSALPRRILPATSKPSDTMPSLASPTSAFTPLTHCQMEENEDNFAHGVKPNHQSTSSSADVSQSTSSVTSLSSQSDDNIGNYVNNASNQETSRPSLFHAVVRMIAMAEGGIIDPNDPEFGFATNDALYGILINKTHRLVYTRPFGLRLVQLIE